MVLRENHHDPAQRHSVAPISSIPLAAHGTQKHSRERQAADARHEQHEAERGPQQRVRARAAVLCVAREDVEEGHQAERDGPCLECEAEHGECVVAAQEDGEGGFEADGDQTHDGERACDLERLGGERQVSIAI